MQVDAIPEAFEIGIAREASALAAPLESQTVDAIYQERLVPVHEEAAAAIRSLQLDRDGEPTRGFPDELAGRLSRRLFVHYGKTFSAPYLFETPLLEARAGLVTADGKATITAHRFRHTVGMQLAERGARLNTIMKILGDASAGMTMVYAQVTDQAVLRDYQAVLGPGAMIAGPCAETIHAGDLSNEAVDWLKPISLKPSWNSGIACGFPRKGHASATCISVAPSS